MTLKIIRPKRITGTDFLSAIIVGITLGIGIYIDQNNQENYTNKSNKPKK